MHHSDLPDKTTTCKYILNFIVNNVLKNLVKTQLINHIAYYVAMHLKKLMKTLKIGKNYKNIPDHTVQFQTIILQVDSLD